MGEIFSREFPDSCDVVVRREPERGVLRVVVRGRRPNPTWLAAHRAAARVAPWCKVPSEVLRRGLMAAVRAEPGRGPSHYARLPRGAGGVGGAQHRKEQALAAMVAAGELVLRELPTPQGRRRVGVYPAGAAGV